MSTSVTRRTFAAAAALGAAVFGAAPAAEAAVQFVTFNQSLSNGGSDLAPASLTQTFDVTGDGTADFSFTHATTPVTELAGTPFQKTDYNGKLTIDSATAAQFVALVKDADTSNGAMTNPLGSYAETLAAGSVVGSSATFFTLAGASPLLDSSTTGNTGSFSVATGELTPSQLDTVYVGFQIGSGANAHYGYLQFANVDNDDALTNDDFNDATLVGAAFETTAGAPITVAPIPVPEPTALAAVAGLSLLTIARRRRS